MTDIQNGNLVEFGGGEDNKSQGPSTPKRAIRPRPLDVELGMPVIHIKVRYLIMNYFNFDLIKELAIEDDLSIRPSSSSEDVSENLSPVPLAFPTISSKKRRRNNSSPIPLPTKSNLISFSSSFEGNGITNPKEEGPECSQCGAKGSDMILCDGCPRYFHPGCVDLKKAPRGIDYS